MSKAKRLRAKRAADRTQALAALELSGPDYSQKLQWAEAHIDALEEAIKAWGERGAYALVHELDPETGHHVLYAQIKEPIEPEWPLLAGDAVHNLRSALDHLAFDMLRRHHGGSLSDALMESSEFPVIGTISPRTGQTRTTPDNDFDSLVGRNLGTIPDALREALRDLQPYKRGPDFASHEIWLVHDLDRVDKHRHLHLITSAANLTQMTMGGAGHFPYFWFGGGHVKDGDKVCEWADPTGPNPQLNAEIAQQIVLGQPEAGAGRELVPTLRALREFFDSDVLPKLAPFL